jgi:hypothetical protein
MQLCPCQPTWTTFPSSTSRGTRALHAAGCGIGFDALHKFRTLPFQPITFAGVGAARGAVSSSLATVSTFPDDVIDRSLHFWMPGISPAPSTGNPPRRLRLISPPSWQSDVSGFRLRVLRGHDDVGIRRWSRSEIVSGPAINWRRGLGPNVWAAVMLPARSQRYCGNWPEPGGSTQSMAQSLASVAEHHCRR